MDTNLDKARKLIEALDAGALGYAHSNTIAKLKEQVPELASQFSPRDYIEENALVVIRPEYLNPFFVWSNT